MRLFSSLLVVVLLAASLATTAAQPTAGPELHLHRSLLPSGSLTAPRALAASGGPLAIIQFRGPISVADRSALDATGVEVLEYVPDFAYLVRGDDAQLAIAAALPSVYGRFAFTPADKLSPALLEKIARGEASVGNVRVVGWPGAQTQVGPALQSARVDTSLPLSVAEVLNVAALPSVRWIEPVSQPRLLNDVARGIMHVNAAWQNRGLYGNGQIVAVADSGLDTGNLATISPDFAGRVYATHILAPGGDLEDENGHGTHVSGSILGAGVQSGAKPKNHQYAGSFAGVAPEAKLVMQAFEADANGAVVGLPDDYYTLFAQAYADGARLHSDSWGDVTGTANQEAAFGGYPYGSQRTDQFIWDHPDMAIFFAAGNSGADGVPDNLGFCTGGDGVIDADSLLMPGTAKNVITVGASENVRSEGGLSAYPWALFNIFCLGVDPVGTDLVSDNANGMAAFSSRGPTDDGRIKPDIVSPGTNIVSNRSHVNGAGLWGPFNDDYEFSGGTSMATPLTAGAGALVREWLQTRGISQPSAAAIKAVLLNTAADMAPGQYGTGAKQEIPFARPNNVEGWGRTDLDFIGAASPYTIWVDDHTTGLRTNDTVSYASIGARPLDVTDSSQPLRVMLTWSDPPASLSASRQLVNDLDLVVRGPDGTIYRGNGRAGADRTNNVEGVIVPNPPVGRYTVEVRGYNVPIKSQPYALAVAGNLGSTTALSVIKSASPSTFVAAGDLITYTLALNAAKTINQTTTLTDTLPLNTTLVTASSGGALQGAKSRVVAWKISSLPAGATVIRTLTVRVSPVAGSGTSILNSDYGAAVGDMRVTGPPVAVSVQSAQQIPRPIKMFVPVARR